MLRVPHYIASLSPYVPGKPVEELERELGIKDSVKLASNENPIGPSPMAVAALTSEAIKGVNRYPDGGGYYLKQKLASRLGVKDAEVILGNGSNELLDIAVRTFMEPGDDAVMAWPSFVVYPMAVQAQGCNAIKVPCKGLKHDLPAMADAITDKTRMVFIANPNNPTGTYNAASEFDDFMKRVPADVLVVIDEAYFEYVTAEDYAESMKHFRDGRNVLILRTFSKIYGLAGLRIGYGIASASILEEMNRIREPFNTGTLAQAAALAALDDEEHVRKSREINAEGKAYLYGELERLKLEYVPSQANFIFMLIEGDSSALYEKLLKRGVIVRPAGPGALRVTVGLHKENSAFIKALEAVL